MSVISFRYTFEYIVDLEYGRKYAATVEKLKKKEKSNVHGENSLADADADNRDHRIEVRKQ